MNNKPKLELTWIGKDQQPKLEPRILIEDPEKSYGDKNTENMLIYGDNLLALKALEQDFTGKIKCIYIDPPYNTGNAFEHYDDGVEHSVWLNLIKSRLEILYNLLSTDGIIFISIDDTEQAYLKILCDELFGRENYCGSFIWEKKRKPSFLSSQLATITEYVLAFSKNRNLAPPFILSTVESSETYPLYNAGNARGIIKFPVGAVKFLKFSDGIYPPKEYKEKTSSVKLINELIIENGTNKNEFLLEGEWRYSQDSIYEQIKAGDYYVVKTKKFRPRRVFASNSLGKKMHNLLSRAHYDIATYEDATAESINLFGDNPFTYPKPEMLISVLINSVTKINDLVLDSFLGSGTTAAVAHKMKRKWIGIELGEHCHTHCIPRLQKVCDGTDQGGISKSVNWKGGGGFKYYYLAPSLLKQDKYGNWIIEEKYNADMLAAAMAKHNNFKYQPSEEVYWKQGQSSEKDFIYTTTQFITVEKLDQIHEEMQPDESLLICCKKFSKPCENRYSNITIKKIPQMLLGKCEFGREDYSLNIITMPRNENEPEFVPKGPNKKKVVKEEADTPDLFEDSNGADE